MSVYLDTITLIMSCAVLLAYAKWIVTGANVFNVLGFVAVTTYLFAQTGWTVAFLQGDVWGRDLSNYIWFTFNSLIMIILGLIWFDRK